MSTRVAFSRFAVLAVALVLFAGFERRLPRERSRRRSPRLRNNTQHPAATLGQEHGGHDMQMAREGSGTAWLPDTTPMYAIHWQRGPWQFMAHENAFVQFLHESGDRGRRPVRQHQLDHGHGAAERGQGPRRVPRHVQRRAVDHPRLWLS